MLAALHARFEGGRVDEAAYEKSLARNVREIVRKQVEAGIDIVSDGECSKPSFMAYRAERIGGFEPRVPKGGMPAPGRLSTITRWPSAAPSRSEMNRAGRSVGPPALKPTTSLTGLSG